MDICLWKYSSQLLYISIYIYLNRVTPYQRNVLNFSILFLVFEGMLYKTNYLYNGIANMTELSKVTLPPIDNNLLFHPCNLFFNFIYQNIPTLNRHRFPMNRNPKHVIGKWETVQQKISADLLLSNSLIFNGVITLLW